MTNSKQRRWGIALVIAGVAVSLTFLGHNNLTALVAGSALGLFGAIMISRALNKKKEETKA